MSAKYLIRESHQGRIPERCEPTPCPDGGECHKTGETCGDPICVQWHADLAKESLRQKKKVPTAERIRQLMDYDGETGLMTWKPISVDDHPIKRIARTRNTLFAGKVVGVTYRSGRSVSSYIRTRVDGRDYDLHRLIWLHQYGEWPDQSIDHIDGDGTNNRLENLRCVSQQENCRNARRRKDNSLGITGVCFDKARVKWKAQICRKDLGRYDTLLDAAAARKSAEVAMGFSDRHGSA